MDGLKVEALAANPESIDKAVLAIATDDEGLGGVSRPVADRKKKVITDEQIRKGEYHALTLN